MDDNNDNNKTNLIVNYLPQQMADEEFENLFKKFGSMKSCKIVRNRSNGYSYGFGFVDFETHDQAIQAIQELNGYELEKKKIKVAFARPAGQDIKQANLYIKNVPDHWTQDDVRKIFEPYGSIIQVRVLGNNRNVAFVLFDLRKQAEDALEGLNGKTVDGCTLPFEIKFAADKKEKGGGNNSKNNNNNLNGSNNNRRDRNRSGYGRDRRNNQGRSQSRFNNNNNINNNNNNNNSNNFDDRQKVGQSQYNAIPYGGGGNQYNPYNGTMNSVGPIRQTQSNKMNRFAPFIPIQQQMAPTATALAPMAPTIAYGYTTTAAQQPMIPFTMMPTQQMAPQMQTVSQPNQMTAAATQMSIYGAPQMPIGYAPMTQNAMDNIYTVASNNLTNAANMQPQFGQPMAGMRNSNNNNNSNNNSNQASGDDGVTLFVYNIGPDSDENELKSLFEPYGQVIKCNVVRKTPGGETKGFGFVTLKDRIQADSAIAGLNGSMKNGRTLQVSFKK